MIYGHKKIVIGGAGSLEVEPGLVLADSGERMHETLDQLRLPHAYAAAARGARDSFNVLRTSNRLWTYFSPAMEIAPSERTGRFRVGGDQAVRDADGRSRISAEDAALAVVDGAELPRFVQRRFTIGYRRSGVHENGRQSPCASPNARSRRVKPERGLRQPVWVLRR